MGKLQVIIKYKKIDFYFDSVTSIEHANSFNLDELQTAENATNEQHFKFMKYIKRNLLDALSDSFTHVTMEISIGDIKTTHVFHGGNKGSNILCVDYDSATGEGYRRQMPTKGIMIRKSIEMLSTRFNIKTF